ncbi:hypothetical protein HJ01_01390 [Flavobacterium frigoris PS1]|uniref:Uncharacterized protein n=1 Tax=Flavobacterium frigoris (strain PS1) TaxID=1086011 RepID=H7FQD0_FLAFP|nr:hypothetical protein HJ01_01390 [Flavobacterium frigoris PS1]
MIKFKVNTTYGFKVKKHDILDFQETEILAIHLKKALCF